MKHFLVRLGWILALYGCSNSHQEQTAGLRFTLLPASHTGIDFVNQVDYTESFNVYTYRNFYNGGGVGLADFNNDGLTDIYFCGNLVNNKLYINKGNLSFEEIAGRAGVACPDVWSTGVSLVDINGDGWTDIYVCKSGSPDGTRRFNELFINNHDLTFTEKAHEYGLDITGLSTHAAFFDYDQDGDLDCYLLTNSIKSVGNFDLVKDQRKVPDPAGGGNKLLRNDNGHFSDVSTAAGIYTSHIGFGLGVAIADINQDNWPDIYVSNDFFERDYLYINKADGTFAEVGDTYFSSMSMGSMGADIADIDNNGYPDIFVTEMLPRDNRRLKTKASFDNWNKYQLNLSAGYFHQFPRNVLQVNNGDGTFSEAGRLAGVEATDWSWGALMFDMDNDGQKDIFVANAIYKDLLDQDYINYLADPATIRGILSREKAVLNKLIDNIPSEPLPNYAFRNKGKLEFENRSADWGLGDAGFSNGSAYGDLDNDGDLDLVVNNVNMPSFVYRNESSGQQHTH
ncbi:MAG: VCBS repeat-containing protein, partial [Cyclobacteriaceae bacterium]|nr:VCBS repeat-containing protein [Cyclobacteriaceae bacterium]